MQRASSMMMSVVFLWAGLARADGAAKVEAETSNSSHYGLSLHGGLGTSQAYGQVGAGRDPLADWGGALEAEVAGRIGDHFTVGVYGALTLHSPNRGESAAYGGSAGLRVGHAFAPHAAVSPRISLGAGWRGYSISRDSARESLQGFDVLRLQVALAQRVSPNLRLSPVLGASLAVFPWAKEGAATGYSEVGNPGLSVFVFGGIRAEFEVLGSGG